MLTTRARILLYTVALDAEMYDGTLKQRQNETAIRLAKSLIKTQEESVATSWTGANQLGGLQDKETKPSPTPPLVPCQPM